MLDFRLVAIAGVVVLSGCGGSGGGGASSGNSAFDALVDRAEALSEALEDVDELKTPVADLPPTGSATYTGVAFYLGIDGRSGSPTAFGAFGEFSGEADFASETFTGTADGFIEVENVEALIREEDTDPVAGDPVSGSFTVNTAFDSFDDAGTERSMLIGDIDGSIRHGDGSTQTYTDMDVDGGLIGPGGALVEIIGSGASSDGVAGAVSIVAGQ